MKTCWWLIAAPRADEVAEFPELVRFEFSVKEKRILCLLV